jgi:hypothetical protein
MSCFIVPLIQAAATSAYRRIRPDSTRFFGRNLASLEKMLWGGSIMLIVDHIANGELTWKFPFLTALGAEGGVGVVLREMIGVGLPMSLVITLVWVAWSVWKESRQMKPTH